MAECFNCHREIEPNAEECPHCGADLTEPPFEKKPHCGTPQSPPGK